MKTVTLNTAIEELPELIKNTLENQEETINATDDGAVVMVDQKEWNNMLEHINILKDKRGMRAILETIEEDAADNFTRQNIEEVVHELQTAHT